MNARRMLVLAALAGVALSLAASSPPPAPRAASPAAERGALEGERPSEATGPWPGLAAPGFAGRALDGTAFSLGEYVADSGAHLLLNFWATWCGPCREELPLLAQAHEEGEDLAAPARAPAPVRVVAVNMKETTEEVTAFFGDELPPFPVLLDDGTAAGAYLIWAIPTTFLIDPEGRILGRIQGPLTPDRLCLTFEEAGLRSARCSSEA